MKDIYIKDAGGDGLMVSIPSHPRVTSCVRIQHITRDDSYEQSWYGNRQELRALIEALRQADAETRTGPEFIARHSFGSTGVVLLRAGSSREEDFWYLTPSGFFDPKSKTKVEEFIREKTAGTILEGAAVFFHGFPDEPNEG